MSTLLSIEDLMALLATPITELPPVFQPIYGDRVSVHVDATAFENFFSTGRFSGLTNPSTRDNSDNEASLSTTENLDSEPTSRECRRETFHIHSILRRRKRELTPSTHWPKVAMHSSPFFIGRLQRSGIIRGHNSCINTVNWNDSGDLLVSGGDDKNLIITKYPDVHHQTIIPTGHTANIFCARFFPYKNEWVVTCSGDHQVRLFDISTQKLLLTYEGHQDRVKKCVISPSPCTNSLYSCSDDGSVNFLDLRSKLRQRHTMNSSLLYNHRPPETHHYRRLQAFLSDPTVPFRRRTATRPSILSRHSDTVAIFSETGVSSPQPVTSIAIASLRPELIVIGGHLPAIWLLDCRMLRTTRGRTEPVAEFKPKGRPNCLRTTGVNISSDGRRVIGSWSEERIYQFDVHTAISSTFLPPELTQNKLHYKPSEFNGFKYRRTETHLVSTDSCSREKNYVQIKRAKHDTDQLPKSLKTIFKTSCERIQPDILSDTDSVSMSPIIDQLSSSSSSLISSSLSSSIASSSLSMVSSSSSSSFSSSSSSSSSSPSSFSSQLSFHSNESDRIRDANDESKQILHTFEQLPVSNDSVFLEQQPSPQCWSPVSSYLHTSSDPIEFHSEKSVSSLVHHNVNLKKNYLAKRCRDVWSSPDPEQSLYISSLSSSASTSSSGSTSDCDYTTDVFEHPNRNRNQLTRYPLGRNKTCSSIPSRHPTDSLWNSGIAFSAMYKGHCNARTIKEVQYMGPNCEWVASGSDDGRFFIWNAATSRLCCIGHHADADVVNCVTDHPTEPTILTAGISSTIKVWRPGRRNCWINRKCPKVKSIISSNEQRRQNPTRGVTAGHAFMFVPAFHATQDSSADEA